MDSSRIARLADQILVYEVASYQKKLLALQRKIKEHRPNPSESGAIDQIKDVYDRDLIMEYIFNCEHEIRKRKESGRFNPKPVKREFTSKSNPPVHPAIDRTRAPQPVRTSNMARKELFEDTELPIKVIDKFGVRAWQPSDGPIHGETPSDTITDIRKTSVPRE